MKQSIAFRLAIQIAGLSALGVAVIALVTYQAVAMWQGMQQQKMLQNAATSIEELLLKNQELDAADMWSKLDELLLNLGHVRASILGSDGNILYGPAELTQRLENRISRNFPLPDVEGPMSMTQLRLVMDIGEDRQLLDFLQTWLVVATFTWGLLVLLISSSLARLGLAPLRWFSQKISELDPSCPKAAISHINEPVELHATVRHFNRLMAKVADHQEQLRAFNSNVAHELNTPLANLRASHELILRSKNRDPLQMEDALHSHLEELQRMNRIVQSMLFLSHVQQGQYGQLSYTGPLNPLVGSVIDYLEAALDERGLECSVLGTASATVEPELFKRALSNLLTNAVRYSNAHSEIQILLKDGEHENEVLVSVVNTGQSIPEDIIPRLFEPFYRADAARVHSQTNHGLGLAIVAAIAKVHGGEAFASCRGNRVEIGFSISIQPATQGM